MTIYDDALIAAAYISYHTETPPSGEYIPMTSEEAAETFWDWLRDHDAQVWEEGAQAGLLMEHSHSYAVNPYKDSE